MSLKVFKRMKEEGTERSGNCWFTLQVTAVVRASPGWTPSGPPHGQRSYLPCFPGALAGGCFWSRAAGLKQRQCCIWQLSLLHHCDPECLRDVEFAVLAGHQREDLCQTFGNWVLKIAENCVSVDGWWAHCWRCEDGWAFRKRGHNAEEPGNLLERRGRRRDGDHVGTSRWT